LQHNQQELLLLNKKLKAEIQDSDRELAKANQKYYVESEQKRLILQNQQEKLELAEIQVRNNLISDIKTTKRTV
jgi:hypothetical protein